jgi:hypothetical protein
MAADAAGISLSSHLAKLGTQLIQKASRHIQYCSTEIQRSHSFRHSVHVCDNLARWHLVPHTNIACLPALPCACLPRIAACAGLLSADSLVSSSASTAVQADAAPTAAAAAAVELLLQHSQQSSCSSAVQVVMAPPQNSLMFPREHLQTQLLVVC